MGAIADLVFTGISKLVKIGMDAYQATQEAEIELLARIERLHQEGADAAAAMILSRSEESEATKAAFVEARKRLTTPVPG